MNFKPIRVFLLASFFMLGVKTYGQSAQEPAQKVQKSAQKETLSKEHQTDMLLFNQTFNSTNGKPVKVQVDYRRTEKMTAEQKKALESNPERYVIINKPE